jgi:hypothetical protein
MNKLGGVYHDDERVNYNFSFYDNEGKQVEVRFRAEPDYDLDTIFNEFRNFLIATGHDIEGQIGELGVDDDDWDDESAEQSLGVDCVEKINDFYASKDKLVQNPTQIHQDKFSMENFPNNGWPFGGLTTASIPALTTADIAPLTVTDLSTNQTYSYSDWTKVNQFPTMSPLTSEQITSWSLPTQDIKSWQVNMPGTLGGAKVQYK